VTVHNLTRQFVFVFGILLSFSNGDSLFAATICRPESIAVEPGDVFPIDIVPRDPVSPPVEDHGSELDSSAFANAMPNEDGEATTALYGSSNLLGNSFSGPLEKLSAPSTESNGLDGGNGSRPTPRHPPAPSERGESDLPGSVRTTGPKDQQVGLSACSDAPTREWEERLSLHNVRLISDSPIVALFRPPRERAWKNYS
jgi:hypothetical protein